MDMGRNLVPFENTCAVVEYVSGDLTDNSLIEQLGKRYEYNAIIHLAAILPQSQSILDQANIVSFNVHTTINALKLAADKKCRFVFPSTALVYGNQESPFDEGMTLAPADHYSLSKVLCEQVTDFYSQKYVFPSAILRAGTIYGPGQTGNMFIPSIISSLINGSEFNMTKGEQKRDFLFVKDMVLAILKILDNSEITGIFNISSGKPYSLEETALIIERLTGTSGRIKFGTIPYRESETWEYHLDCSKAFREMGWKAITTLEDGLQQTVEYEKLKRKR